MAREALPTTQSAPRRRSRILTVFQRNPLVLGGTVFILALIVVALIAPWLVTHDPTAVNILSRLSSPSGEHLLGTDQFGRDIYSRVVMGTRVSLLVGVLATGAAAAVGIMLGALAGWVGGWFDDLVMRVMDVILAFPAIVLAIALAAVFGPGLDKVITIIAFSRVPQFARIARGTVLTVRELDFVSAATALGRRHLATLWRHVLPNSIAPLLVYASISIATAINTEAALSFLGLGIQPPAPSWGTMLSDAKQYMLLSPWLAIFPGAAITLTVLAFNLVGDGLRDLTDPRMRRRR